MKKFFNVMLIVAVLAVFTIPGFAAGGCHGEKAGSCCKDGDGCFDKISKDLDLSADQKAKLDKMRAECKAKKAKMTADQKLKQEDDCMKKVSTVLNAEQMAKLKSMKEKCKTKKSAKAGSCCSKKDKASKA